MTAQRDVAIFVDAGYVWAQGERGLRVQPDSVVAFDAQGFVGALLGISSGLGDLLRVYWYDAAKDGPIPGDQLAIAEIEGVKLRLGKISAHGNQKGVDTLLVRDLIVLSSERTISRAVIVTGDDDFREAISYAQERGVRVTLLTVPDRDGTTNAGRDLCREADTVLTLDRATVEGCFSLAMGPPPPLTEVQRPGWMSGAIIGSRPTPSEEIQRRSTAFARSWLETASLAEVRNLIGGRPNIPREVDAQLLHEASQGRVLSEESRFAARTAFWAVVDNDPSS